MNTVVCGRWNRHSSQYDETRALRTARTLYDKKEISREELRRAEDAVMNLLVAQLQECGISIISDGGFRHDSVYDITRHINGCGGFSRLTRIPETNHFHRQPEAQLPLSQSGPILEYDSIYAKKTIKKPYIFCLPGPYAMALQTKNCDEIGRIKLAYVYAKILNEEIRFLLNNGALFVRIEEPHMLEEPDNFMLFRSIMCHLVRDIDPSRLALATWYGDIRPFYEYFYLPFGIFFVDFVEERKNVEALRNFPQKKILVAGILDARHTYEEESLDLAELLAEIEAYVPRKMILLSFNTDLHFLPWNEALKKARRLSAFAEIYDLRKEALVKKERAKTVKPEEKEEYFSPRECPYAIKHEIARSSAPRTVFGTSSVGSFPQSRELRHARVLLRKGEIDYAAYRERVNLHTKKWIDFQNEIGIDVPVDGEFLREDMAVYFSAAFGGRILDFVPSYENLRYHPVEFFDAVRSPESPITKDEFLYAQSLTKKPIKATITGPATLADWALLSHKKYYFDRRALRKDLANSLRGEIQHLLDAGARIIQIDEPALTTKMKYFDMDCEALYEMIREYDGEAYMILHICYSDMKALSAAFPAILDLPFHQIHMEMANRNYILLSLIDTYGFAGKDIGLGVIDVHTDRIESVDEIVAGVQQARKYFSPEQIWLTPDCGLKERSDAVARVKLQTMSVAAQICRMKLEENTHM